MHASRAQVLRTVAAQVERIELLEGELSGLAGYFPVRVAPPSASPSTPATVEIDLCNAQCTNKVTLAVHITTPLAYPDKELVVDIQRCVGSIR